MSYEFRRSLEHLSRLGEWSSCLIAPLPRSPLLILALLSLRRVKPFRNPLLPAAGA